jgi:mannosyltransferase OCH1-like enzyme
MIPKTIHLIWLGGPLPEKFKYTIEEIRRINNDYEIMEWTDHNINFPLINQNLFNQTQNLGSKSDILRFELLKKYGGIYMDYDFISVKKFDELLHHDFFVGSGDNETVWNSIVGSIPNHPIVDDFIMGLGNAAPVGLGKHNITNVMETTGPNYLTRVFLKHKNMDGVKIYKKDYFFPFDSLIREEVNKLNNDNDIERIKSYAKPETFCIHFHTCEWQ